MFDRPERLLDFGNLVAFEVDQGIDDTAWRQVQEEPDVVEKLGTKLFDVAG